MILPLCIDSSGSDIVVVSGRDVSHAVGGRGHFDVNHGLTQVVISLNGHLAFHLATSLPSLLLLVGAADNERSDLVSILLI